MDSMLSWATKKYTWLALVTLALALSSSSVRCFVGAQDFYRVFLVWCWSFFLLFDRRVQSKWHPWRQRCVFGRRRFFDFLCRPWWLTSFSLGTPVFLRCTEFYRVLPSFFLCGMKPSFDKFRLGFRPVFFSRFHRVSPSFTEFYRVLPSFTEFYRVLPSFHWVVLKCFHFFDNGWTKCC